MTNRLLFVVFMSVFFSACVDVKTENSVDLGILANPNADSGSSYSLQATSLYIDRQALRGSTQELVTAISYADFDQDGDQDVFMAPVDGTENAKPSELYLNDGSGNFTLDSNFFNGSPPGQVHSRKALTGDFNGDARPDIFVIGHGLNQEPFPGDAPYLILSSDNGYVRGAGLDSFVGFQHGGSSADIDADGDLDILVADTSTPYFLINDGTGNFKRETARLGGLNNTSFLTAELVDIDRDGYIDILAGGYEVSLFTGNFQQQAFTTQILWGDSTGFYTPLKSTALPAVNRYGIVVDIDVADIDMDGDKDIVVSRTGDGTASQAFYIGYSVQIVENTGNRTFADKTIEKFSASTELAGSWIDWLRLQDFNADGHVDVIVDDAARNLIWYNDGLGNFN